MKNRAIDLSQTLADCNPHASIHAALRVAVGAAPRSAAWTAVGAALALLSACTAPSAGIGKDVAQYRCEFGIEFSARFVDDTAILDGSRGYDLLRRAAGSLDKNYKNPRMAAEFGLGATGREAVLRYPLLPLVARCVRD